MLVVQFSGERRQSVALCSIIVCLGVVNWLFGWYSVHTRTLHTTVRVSYDMSELLMLNVLLNLKKASQSFYILHILPVDCLKMSPHKVWGLDPGIHRSESWYLASFFSAGNSKYQIQLSCEGGIEPAKRNLSPILQSASQKSERVSTVQSLCKSYTITNIIKKTEKRERKCVSEPDSNESAGRMSAARTTSHLTPRLAK